MTTAVGVRRERQYPRHRHWCLFIHVAANGARSAGLLFDPASGNPLPVTLVPESDQVFLSLHGTGFRRAAVGTCRT